MWTSVNPCVEAKLRQWLVAHQRLHEPRRVTLIRMLGAGLNSDKNAKLTPRGRD
jgi:hypothetical protein